MKKGFWQIDLGGISVSSKVVCRNGCQAIVDTGTSMITGPYRDVVAINKAIGAFFIYKTKYYVLDCNKIQDSPNVDFKIGGKLFSLKPDDYVIKVK